MVRLWQYTQENNFDVVYTHYEEKHHAGWRNLGSRFTNFCANYLLDKPKGLYLSSFRCLNRFTAQTILAHTGPFPYVDGLIMQITQNIGALRVTHLPRESGDSNYTLARLLRLFFVHVFKFFCHSAAHCHRHWLHRWHHRPCGSIVDLDRSARVAAPLVAGPSQQPACFFFLARSCCCLASWVSIWGAYFLPAISDPNLLFGILLATQIQTETRYNRQVICLFRLLRTPLTIYF